MSNRTAHRRLSLLLAACLLVAALALGAPHADAAVLINATPSTNITGTTVIDVTVTGLTPGQVVSVFQSAPGGSIGDGTGPLAADGSGNLTTKLVARPILDMFWFPSPPPAVDCRVSACTVAVAAGSFGPALASTPITFTAGADPSRPAVTFAPTTNLQNGSAVSVTSPAGVMNPGFQYLAMVQCTSGGFPFLCGPPSTFSNPGGDGGITHPFTVSDFLPVNGFPPFNCRTTSCTVYYFASIGSFSQALAQSPVLTWGTPPPVHLNIAWDLQNGVTDPVVYQQLGVLKPNSALTFEQCVTNTAICNPVENHTTDNSGFFSGTVTIFPVAGIGTPQATVCHPDPSTDLCSIKVNGTSGFNSPVTFWRGITFANGPAPPVPVVPSGSPAGVGKVSVSSALPVEYPGDAAVTVTASPGGQSCQFVRPFGTSTTPASCTINGLSPSTTYDLSASASSVWGSSGSSASSQVTTSTVGSITGLVRNSAKRPLPGMLVVSTSDGSTPSGVAVTAADGTFSMTVPVGDHKVATIDPGQFGGNPDHYVAEFYDNAGSSDLSSATVVSVSAGNATALNTITLDHNHPGSVSGVVYDGSAPLPGMLTVLLQDDAPTPFALGITAGDGSFSIGNVPPGTYKLITIDMAYGSSSYYLPEFYDNAGSTLPDFATAQTIVVTPSTDTPLNTISLDHTP